MPYLRRYGVEELKLKVRNENGREGIGYPRLKKAFNPLNHFPAKLINLNSPKLKVAFLFFSLLIGMLGRERGGGKGRSGSLCSPRGTLLNNFLLYTDHKKEKKIASSLFG